MNIQVHVPDVDTVNADLVKTSANTMQWTAMKNELPVCWVKITPADVPVEKIQYRLSDHVLNIWGPFNGNGGGSSFSSSSFSSGTGGSGFSSGGGSVFSTGGNVFVSGRDARP